MAGVGGRRSCESRGPVNHVSARAHTWLGKERETGVGMAESVKGHHVHPRTQRVFLDPREGEGARQAPATQPTPDAPQAEA